LKGYRWNKSNSKENIFKQFLEKINVFSLDDKTIELAADIYADLRKNGKIIGDADILIAAIVIMNRGTLISNNAKHYENIQKLHLINWLE
jgi:predicted nucleic acid-binding protein